jgi:hypothetical protein
MLDGLEDKFAVWEGMVLQNLDDFVSIPLTHEKCDYLCFRVFSFGEVFTY